MGGAFNRNQSASQSWKEMIESYGSGSLSSANNSFTGAGYGYGSNKMGMMDGSMAPPVPSSQGPAAVHADQKPPCPFKLKNPDDKCPNFDVCREYYEHGTSYCKYMKRQMDANKGMY